MSLIVNLPNPPLSPPVLSVGFAVGASTLFTLSYVGSLYLSPAGRLAGKQDADGNVMDRDHPVVVRSRIETASLATAATVLATGIGLWIKGVVPKAVSHRPPLRAHTMCSSIADTLDPAQLDLLPSRSGMATRHTQH